MNFKLKGVQEQINALKNVESELSQEVHEVLRAGALSIEEAAKNNAPYYSGGIQQKIQHAELSHLRFEVAANAYHSPYIEFGTRGYVKIPPGMEAIAAIIQKRPRRKGTFGEMVKAIAEWGKKKKYFEEDAAFFVALKIFKKGIKPQPFLYPAFISKQKGIVADIKAVLNEKSG